jgi:hypothetical protein
VCVWGGGGGRVVGGCWVDDVHIFVCVCVFVCVCEYTHTRMHTHTHTHIHTQTHTTHTHTHTYTHTLTHTTSVAAEAARQQMEVERDACKEALGVADEAREQTARRMVHGEQQLNLLMAQLAGTRSELARSTLETAQLEAFAANLKSDLHHQYRMHQYEEEEWKQKLEVEEARVSHLSNSLEQMKEALGFTHLSLVQLQGAHQENQALIEALDKAKERLGKFEITSLVLAKDNSEIPYLMSHNASLQTELGQKAEQLHLVSEALIRSQLENSFLPGLRADKDRLEAECSQLQAQLANAEAEVAQQAQRLQELSELPKSVHALEAQRTLLQNRHTEVLHASQTWEERAMRAQSLLSEAEAEMLALRKERGDLLAEVDRVNKEREGLDVELYQCRTALEQMTHDFKAHTYCHAKLSKEIQLREKVEQELFEFQAAHKNCKEDTRQLRLQSMKLAAAPAPGIRTPIVGVGILLGKYDEHSQKAGKIYILKLTPNSPAMELYLESKAEKELPDIAEHDVLIKIDGTPVQGMDLDLVFDAIRGNKV